ncbi:MAG: hypothetical protein Q7T18_04475 [Sedimentisphaerales bacterium]|nr:hypothetical protein [Sedimentisphaerales bacterium]
MNVSHLIFLANFKTPCEIGGDSMSLIWLLPLLAAVAVVYKALKLSTIEAGRFCREVVMLFGTILLFMALIAVGLYVINRIISG